MAHVCSVLREQSTQKAEKGDRGGNRPWVLQRIRFFGCDLGNKGLRVRDMRLRNHG